MARRSSPLSLKARAIALLAQREHSVAELRRKLLRLAELQELQAWVEAHEAAPGPRRLPPGGPGDSATAADHAGPSVPGRDAPSEATVWDSRPSTGGVGSFDLDEDWADGELESFLADWDVEPAWCAGGGDAEPEGAPEVNAQTLQDLMALPKGFCAGGDDLRQSGVTVRGLDAGDGASGVEVSGSAQHRRGRSAHASSRRAAAEARRPRPAPSAEAWAAVRDDERQQARAESVEQLLLWLQERGYLSEARLVESRINARASRYGNRRIQQELRQLGVAPDEEQQARLKDSELERAREVWRRKFGGELPVDAASRAKQMRFLAARGFSSDVVRRVLRAEDD